MGTEPDVGASPEVAGEVVTIGGLAAGGDGVARLSDGRVVFVEGAAPGDQVSLRDFRAGRRMARARVARVLRPGPDRVEAPCPHFEHCGGCRWQHVRYEAQLEAKRAIVRDALERIGGLSLDGGPEIVASPNAYHYRARARLVEQEGRIGFRVRGSNRVVPIEVCPVLVPEAEAAVETLVANGRRRERPAAEAKPRRRVSTREWELLVGSEGSARVVRVGSRGEVLDGGQRVEIRVLGERVEVSPGSFAQGNALLWDALAREVVSQCTAAGVAAPAKAEPPRRFVELFAGVGFLTLPLARRGLEGTAIESGRSALSDLAANLARAGLTERVEILAGRAERRAELAARLADSDLLLVDPPRSGLDEVLRRQVAESGPARVVYVSCDPATLARDLRPLLAAGYRVASLRALDLFPQTPHVEVVARLERAT